MLVEEKANFIDALFKSRTDKRSVDALFIQYLVTLAFDFKSPLCIPKLLYYLRLGQRRHYTADVKPAVPVEILSFSEPLVIVALSKSLHLWPLTPPDACPCPPDIKKSLVIILLASMADCTDPNSKGVTPQKQRALAGLLLALAKGGHAQFVLTTGENEQGRKEFEVFESAIAKFSKVMQNVDAVLARDVLSSYTMIFAAIKHPNSFSNVEAFLKPTRVFRMIWLESKLLKLKGIQPESFQNELQFFLVHENPLKLISNLVTAAFDGLSVALLRKDSAMNVGLWKSFILKRLPLVVKHLLASTFMNVNPTQVETIICQPITTLSRDTINLIRRPAGNDSIVDEMFPTAGMQNPMSDIRFDLIKAFVMLNILSEHAFQILGQDDAFSYTIPRIDEMALQNDGLVVDASTGTSYYIAEVSSMALQENSEYVSFEDSRIVQLVSSFADLDGIYQERIANELLRLVGFWVEGSNTRNINRLCQALALNPSTIDVLLLHVKPSQLFKPLVALLDDWRHDEDEVNFQEVYTDFGCILLMVILGFERYDLTLADLGREGQEESFCVTMLRQSGNAEAYLDDLTFENRELLGGWITALFDAGAISDDLMKISPVKDLYTLVPTIFGQAVAACTAKIIDLDTLRGGLEYFLQPFLLPSLLGAFRWIGSSIWRQQQDTMTLLQIVTTLLVFELEGEARNIHRIVLFIAAPELYLFLTRISNNPKSIEDQLFVEPKILSILEPYYSVSGGQGTSALLLDQHKSLSESIKEHITILSTWAMNSLESGPPGYNAELLSCAVRELGATAVLMILLSHLNNITASTANTGNDFDTTLDVVTALVVLASKPTGRFLVDDKPDSQLIDVIMEYRDEDVLELCAASLCMSSTTESGVSSNGASASVSTKPAAGKSKPGTTGTTTSAAAVGIKKESSNGSKPISKDTKPSTGGIVNGSGIGSNGKPVDEQQQQLAVFKRLQRNVGAYVSRRKAMEAVTRNVNT